MVKAYSNCLKPGETEIKKGWSNKSNSGGKGKGKGFPYSIPSVGPGADPGVQAVSLQVTVKSSTRW